MEDDIDERPSFTQAVKNFVLRYRALIVILVIVTIFISFPLNVAIDAILITIAFLYVASKKKEADYYQRRDNAVSRRSL